MIVLEFVFLLANYHSTIIMESPSTTATEENDRKLISLSDLHAKFGWEEYVVLFVTLSISGIIGVFWAWKSRLEHKIELARHSK